MKIKSIINQTFVAFFCLIVTLNVCNFVFAEENQGVTVDGINFSVNNNEAEIIEILKGTVVSNNFTIPEEITDSLGNTYPVTSISEYCNIDFFENITSITISKNIIHLYSTAFSSRNLENIYVDEDNSNFCSIDGVLFSKDKKSIVRFPSGRKETEYEIPPGITTIGTSAFSGCDKLAEIVIPDTVTTIYRYAFASCKSITSLKIPEKIQYIDAGVFYGCENLKSVQIPNNININTDNLFSLCSSLNTFTFPQSIKNIGWGMFADCTSLKEVQLNEQMDYLGGEAFKNCTSLSEIAIPEGIEEIGLQCFKGCTSLKLIIIPKSITKFGENCFNDVPSDCIFKFPSGIDIEAYAKLLNINPDQIKTYQINDTNVISETDSIITSDNIRDTNSETESKSSFKNIIIIIILIILIVIGGGVTIKKKS